LGGRGETAVWVVRKALWAPCRTQGFDQHGEELYWTVVGDNVSALAMVDTDGDGNVCALLT
jgi:hypothetical protein